MSSVAEEAPGVVSFPGTDEQLFRRRIVSAENYRKDFEGQWLVALGFLAGQQWIVWDRQARRLFDIRETPEGDRYADVDLYVADIIHEHRGAALGELQTDSDRPELLLPGDGAEDAETEERAKAANRALGHYWDVDVDGDAKLRLARQYCVDLGVSAIRCRYDKRSGEPVRSSSGDQVEAPVGQDGAAIVDPEKARAYVAGLHEAGQTATFDPQYQGRGCWDVGTTFNLLSPPGVPHEDRFPWEIWVTVALLADVQAEYPAAASMQPDADIGSALGVTSQQSGNQGGAHTVPRVADSVWLYTYYERPSKKFPKGRTAVLAGSAKKLLKTTPSLPYQRTNGDWHSGIVYLHWQRLSDRFYSRSLTDALKDPQRMTNRVATQTQEIGDRSMPFVLIEEGTLPQKPSGRPMEFVELKKGNSVQPIIEQGAGPGDWMWKLREQLMSDAQHASTLSALKLGENPTQVSTLGQLELLQEQEASKREAIRSDHQHSGALLAELAALDIARFWPDGKKMLVQGDQNRIQELEYRKGMVPTGFVVRPAKGAARARGQAAQVLLIETLWQGALNAGLVALNPDRWMRWYDESFDSAQPMPMPEPEGEAQEKMALYENFQMLEQQLEPLPAEYDLSPVHVPAHRKGQDEARTAGDVEGFQRIQRHIDLHIQEAPHTRKAWRIIDPADVTDASSDIALDEDQALRENQMLISGETLNPEELAKALQSLQQGLDPETGQPLDPAADKGALVLRASLKPTLVENLQLHLDRHGKVIKSEEFKRYPTDVRERFFTHYDLTRDLYLSLPMLPDHIDPPKVSLTLRESVGPTTVAEVLRRAGVPDADPETIATEPVLANMVQETLMPSAPEGGGEKFPPKAPL